MQITKINPQGYCGGVKKALDIAKKAILSPTTPRPIYLLGSIIHNKEVVKKFEEYGAIIVEDKNKTRLELLDSIDSGSVIFSAHGVSNAVYAKAIKKGLNIIDATCPNVLLVHKRITSYLNDGYDIIYIGTKKHPECEGVLGIDDNIHFIDSSADLDLLSITNDKIYVTNQTTLSKYDIGYIFEKIKEKYPNAIIDDKICNATTVRQEAMANQKAVDLCIVVGDKSSSNTKKLVKVSNEIAHIKTILLEKLDDLDDDMLKDVKTVSISSGASTPDVLVDEIYNYIKEK